MRVFDMTEDVFLNHPDWEVFTFGRPPGGLDFNTRYKSAIFFEEDGLQIRTIHFNNLITTKRASGRSKDMDDLENLIP